MTKLRIDVLSPPSSMAAFDHESESEEYCEEQTRGSGQSNRYLGHALKSASNHQSDLPASPFHYPPYHHLYHSSSSSSVSAKMFTSPLYNRNFVHSRRQSLPYHFKTNSLAKRGAGLHTMAAHFPSFIPSSAPSSSCPMMAMIDEEMIRADPLDSFLLHGVSLDSHSSESVCNEPCLDVNNNETESPKGKEMSVSTSLSVDSCDTFYDQIVLEILFQAFDQVLNMCNRRRSLSSPERLVDHSFTKPEEEPQHAASELVVPRLAQLVDPVINQKEIVVTETIIPHFARIEEFVFVRNPRAPSPPSQVRRLTNTHIEQSVAELDQRNLKFNCLIMKSNRLVMNMVDELICLILIDAFEVLPSKLTCWVKCENLIVACPHVVSLALLADIQQSAICVPRQCDSVPIACDTLPALPGQTVLDSSAEKYKHCPIIKVITEVKRFPSRLHPRLITYAELAEYTLVSVLDFYYITGFFPLVHVTVPETDEWIKRKEAQALNRRPSHWWLLSVDKSDYDDDDSTRALVEDFNEYDVLDDASGADEGFDNNCDDLDTPQAHVHHNQFSQVRPRLVSFRFIKCLSA